MTEQEPKSTTQSSEDDLASSFENLINHYLRGVIVDAMKDDSSEIPFDIVERIGRQHAKQFAATPSAMQRLGMKAMADSIQTTFQPMQHKASDATI